MSDENMGRRWTYADWGAIRTLGSSCRVDLERYPGFMAADVREALTKIKEGRATLQYYWNKFGLLAEGRWSGPLWLKVLTKEYFKWRNEVRANQFVEQQRQAMVDNLTTEKDITMKVVDCGNPPLPGYVTLAQIARGQPFRCVAGTDLYVRLMPSTADPSVSHSEADWWLQKASGHKVPVYDLNSGYVYMWEVSKRVVLVNAEIHHFGDYVRERI
jgi:hypothetical protein